MSMAASRPVCDGRIAVVVMGVSGSGKSTIAKGIAEQLALDCIDGDDLHAPGSVAKMRQGIALDDSDRWPWLARIGARLSDAHQSPAGVVVACSALKRSYREQLRTASPGLRFVFLDGTPAVLRERMAARAGHFMPADLLASQLATLERPAADELDVLTLDVDASVDAVVAAAALALRRGATAM
jgi:gluconokinase